MASAEVGGGERKPTKLPKWEAAWPGRRRSGAGRGVAAGPHPRARALPRPRGLPGAAGWTRPPELPVLGRGGTPDPHGPKAPFQCQGGRGGGSWGCARRLSGPLRTAPRAGRSRRGGRAGRVSLGAKPPHPAAAPESGAPEAEGRRGLCGSPAAREGWGGAVKTETFVPLQTRPTWRTEARLAPNVSESAAAGLGGASGCLLPRLSQPRRGSGFPNTHTSSQRAWGSGGAATTPRYPHADPARRGGTAFPTRPPPALDAGAPAPTLGPRPPALGAGSAVPLTRTLGGPSPRAPGLGAARVSLATERKATKQKKEQREGEGGAEARALRTRLEVGLGGWGGH